MKTFELTYSITTTDGSDIDIEQLERDLNMYNNSELEFIELELNEPDVAFVTYSAKARSLDELPDELEALNDEDNVTDIELYETELVSHTSY